MSRSIEHISPPVSALGKRSAREWLNALTSGDCDQGAFFRALKDLRKADPEVSWEVLAQLDQDYRRGKVNAALFNSIVLRIQSMALGTEADAPGAVTVGGVELTSMRLAPTTPIAAIVPFAKRDTQVVPLIAALDTSRSVQPASKEPVVAAGTHDVGSLLRGRYLLQGLLGRGGTASVFEAIDQSRLNLSGNQRVAVKLLDHCSAHPTSLAELSREFQNLQSLTHPNIVRVYDFDRDGDTTFFTMELLRGSLLSNVVEQNNDNALHRPYALSIVRSVGDALVHAHAHGVVHGDISPRNVFITDTGDVRVLDFGASHTFTPGQWIAHFDADRSPVATPCFASCQLLMGEAPDTRDDVYAVACVAYYLFTGRHPFQNRTAVEARTLKLKAVRPAGLSNKQWQALRAGLSFEREDRPSNIDEWLQQLGVRDKNTRLPMLPGLVTPQQLDTAT